MSFGGNMAHDIRKIAQKLAGRYGQLDVVFDGVGDLTDALERFDNIVRSQGVKPMSDHYYLYSDIISMDNQIRGILRKMNSMIKRTGRRQ